MPVHLLSEVFADTMLGCENAECCTLHLAFVACDTGVGGMNRRIHG
jgi:hypothetical protein